MDTTRNEPDLALLAPQTLGEGLRAALQRADLTAQELAAETHLGASTVHNYVRGERVPDAAALRRIAHALAERMPRNDAPVDADVLWVVFGQLLDRMAEPAGG